MPTLIATAALAAGGCAEKLTCEAEKKDGRAEVTLSFTCGRCGLPSQTKSSVFEGETISDINLYIWREGTCILHEFMEMDSNECRIPLVTEASYSFYVLANCGKSIEPDGNGWREDERSMESLVIRFPEIPGEMSLIPMAAVLGNCFVGGSGLKLNVILVRLVSRIVFSYVPDDSLGASGISITGVRLCDAAQLMTPFSERSVAADGDVADGDFASENDLLAINRGESIEFYAFENCWGDLLEGNTDQKMKVPDEVGNITGPTYIEVSCAFEGSGLLTGDITYRIYLGSDAVSNFDLVRNSSYRVQLFGSREGLDELSWRIDKDVSFNDGLAEWTITQGAHGAGDLYIGEMFLCKLAEIDRSVIAYFGSGLEDMAENCTIRCIGDSADDSSTGTGGGSGSLNGSGNGSGSGSVTNPGNDPIEFSGLGVNSDGEIIFEGICRREHSGGELWICDAEGGKISKIASQVNVKVPEIVFSSEESATNPEAEERIPSATVNGSPATIYAYLCDSGGRNLLANDGKGYGFASDAFNMTVVDDSDSWTTAKRAGCISTYLTDEYSGRTGSLLGQPFCSVNLQMSNTGENIGANYALWTMTGKSGCLNVGIEDGTHAMRSQKPFSISYFPFIISFYDSGYGGKDVAEKYGISSNFFFTVSNRSNMSFSFKYLALTQRGSANKSLSGVTVPSGTGLYFFDCPADINLPSSLYLLLAKAEISAVTPGNFSSCSLTRADDGTLIIGLDKTFYDLIYATKAAESLLSYEQYGYYDSALIQKNYGFDIRDGITAMVDFTSVVGRELNYTFSDRLEDSSSECSYIYSSDYDYKGCSHYSANVYKGHSFGDGSRIFKDYSYITPQNIAQVMQRVCNVEIGMSRSDSPSYTMKTGCAIYNTYIKPALTCKGFCRTHVNGQKKDPVDHSPEASYAPEVTASYVTAGSHTLASGGIATLFNTIYNKTYNDSEKNYIKGTPWKHHSHPTDVILDLSFERVDDSGSWYVYDFEPYSPIDLTYDNSGYSSKYDDNPYTVATSVDWETTHGRFSHKVIMVQ